MVAGDRGRMSRPAEVLVVGAGPTGLTLALQAHAHGARVRIVERRPEPFRPSRALILHPRTLEVLRPLGVTDALVDRADTAPEVRLHLGPRVIPVRLSELALPDTAFPHLTLVRQTDAEVVLAELLESRGVAIERGIELIAVEDGPDQVRATVRSPAGTEEIDCDFVVGCDGPESTVRREAGIGWEGEPYAQEVVLADVELDGTLAAGVAHVVPGRDGLLLVFSIGERATWRLLATRTASGDRPPFGQPGPPVPRAELQALLDEAGLPVRIRHLAWSGRYALQCRLATQFRKGRLFLAGDAAHTSSPASGQGMNTGIQDAANLGWKLAGTPTSRDPNTLLDSYERERRPVARRVLAVTHMVFWAEAATSPLPRLLRGRLAPLGAPVVPLLTGRRRLIAAVERVMSQMWVTYADSPLTVEGIPPLSRGPRTGERLPDRTVTVGGRKVRLHDLLAQPGIHILLERDAAPLEPTALGPHVTVHRLTGTPGTGLIAIRPDGHIGFRCGKVDACQLHSWLSLAGFGPLPSHG